MSLKNNKSAYGWLTIALHWVAAAGFIWIFLTGKEIEAGFEAGWTREELIPLARVHVSIALCFFIFLVARLISHYRQPQPEHLPQHRYFVLLSKIVQQLLLIIIIIMIISGPLIVWLSGNPLRIFDLVAIPSPFPEMKTPHRVMEIIHIVTSKLIIPVLGLHIIGVIKHLVVDRDRTLQRMLWVKKADPAQDP